MKVAEKLRPRAPDEPVSEFTTARLSVYLRCLEALDEAGVATVSSNGLADRLDLNPAQIRKDLAHFGEFGVRGVGYYVRELRQHLRQILGLDRQIKVVIVGAGNLGLALADYPGFRNDGFEIVALFDVAAEKVGHQSRGGVGVRHLRDLGAIVERERIDIAVIAVPAGAAQEVTDRVVDVGIRAILNFSPAALRTPGHVRVRSIDLTVSLESLSFLLAQDANGHGR